MIGNAPGSGDFMCRKWIGCPSMSVVKCGNAASFDSTARQSNSSRQYSAISRTLVRLAP